MAVECLPLSLPLPVRRLSGLSNKLFRVASHIISVQFHFLSVNIFAHSLDMPIACMCVYAMQCHCLYSLLSRSHTCMHACILYSNRFHSRLCNVAFLHSICNVQSHVCMLAMLALSCGLLRGNFITNNEYAISSLILHHEMYSFIHPHSFRQSVSQSFIHSLTLIHSSSPSFAHRDLRYCKDIFALCAHTS